MTSWVRGFVVPELAEAASRTGDVGLVRAALEWLSERTRVTPTDWALGMKAGVGALLSDAEAADRLYRESISHLCRTRNRGELRAAHEMLEEMGMEAFGGGAGRLARDGLSNPEIAARLFFSARTVQYHLSKVFAKLAISSRSQLDRVLPPARPPSVVHTPRRESHVGPAHPAQLEYIRGATNPNGAVEALGHRRLNGIGAATALPLA